MRALVVYESMFGNTHTIADQIGEGLRSQYETEVVPVDEVTHDMVAAADLVVVGGPTHAHGLSHETTRRSARTMAAKDTSLHLEARDGRGLREWLDAMDDGRDRPVAAFDTRVTGPVTLTGRASRAIGRRLRRHGYRMVTAPESFLVDRQNHLVEGEADRALAWSKTVAATATSS